MAQPFRAVVRRGMSMRRTTAKRAALLVVGAAAVALMGFTARSQGGELRVCADPYDLPFSNQQEEGFENKIARLIASDWGTSVTNFWWPHRRGFVRNSLTAGSCDVIMGVPV